MLKTKFSSHKQNLFGLLSSRNAKKAYTDQSILQSSLLYLKRNVSQIFKCSRKKVFLKCVHHWYNLLRRMFFIPYDNQKSLFFIQVNVTKKFSTTAMLLHSLKQVFWKKSAFFICYLQNNITMLLIPKVQNKASTT